jgi:purine-binding chemotaxis protein CheW
MVHMVTTTGTDSYILFELAGSTYALRSDDIQQLEMVGRLTPVPNAPAFVEGVVSIRGQVIPAMSSIRGQVIPAMSLRARFGFPTVPYDARSRLVIVRAPGRRVGLLVDSAREFATIPADSIVPPPDGVAGLSGPYLRGLAQLGERLVLVLDVLELLDVSVHPQLLAAETAPTSA